VIHPPLVPDRTAPGPARHVRSPRRWAPPAAKVGPTRSGKKLIVTHGTSFSLQLLLLSPSLLPFRALAPPSLSPRLGFHALRSRRGGGEASTRLGGGAGQVRQQLGPLPPCSFLLLAVGSGGSICLRRFSSRSVLPVLPAVFMLGSAGVSLIRVAFFFSFYDAGGFWWIGGASRSRVGLVCSLVVVISRRVSDRC
jgi:hypothetical protein